MRYSTMFGRAAVAAVLALSMGMSLQAQRGGYNPIDSGGPLWWFPENDGSYSRHHDRWYVSHVEALHDDWGVATSFPTVPGDVVWVSQVSGAPPNSACDNLNSTEYTTVGPPHDDSSVQAVRTVRTPGSGGFAGLQMSMHIGEWWQGLKYRGYYDDPTARPRHFGGSRSGYDPALFGWFDVRMRDGSGTVLRPPLYDGGHSVTWINPVFSQWRLSGGGGFAMPCLGMSMVQMHGVDGASSGGAFPPAPVGADGGECWSNARPFVLRANSEARCEPNLEERYDYTDRFWAMFDATPPEYCPVTFVSFPPPPPQPSQPPLPPVIVNPPTCPMPPCDPPDPDPLDPGTGTNPGCEGGSPNPDDPNCVGNNGSDQAPGTGSQAPEDGAQPPDSGGNSNNPQAPGNIGHGGQIPVGPPVGPQGSLSPGFALPPSGAVPWSRPSRDEEVGPLRRILRSFFAFFSVPAFAQGVGSVVCPPLFPSDYDAPYLMTRRGEVAIFTASELAETTAPSVPWNTMTYPGAGAAQGAQRSALERRFANRVDPFGGADFGAGTLSLPVQDDPDPFARECVEMGESGWDATTGTLRVDCAHGRENSPMTGNVNRAVMGYGAVERSREAGPVDNASGHGGRAVARRHPGLWAAPAGFGWFEHRNATLGCLVLEADVNHDLIAEARQRSAQWLIRMHAAHARYFEALADFEDCPVTTPSFAGDSCRAQALAWGAAERANVIRFYGYSHGWRIIRRYREAVLPEMEHAVRSASPYGYADSSSRLVATGRVLGFGGRACVTGPGGRGYNEALTPSLPTFERGTSGTGWVGQSSVPAQGGPMWYGPGFDGRGAHAEGDRGDHYSQFADVVGRTTPYSEAELPPGVEYPEELRRYTNYNNVRTGTSVWRDFACATTHDGYYGGGLNAVGTSTLGHRSLSQASGVVQPDRWWRDPDPDVGLGDLSERQYSSGTPCVGDEAYDVRGADGTRRCFELVSAGPPNGNNQGDRWTGGRGAYSDAGVGDGSTGHYRLEYSGDGVSDSGTGGTVWPMRATSYRMIDGSELFALDYRSSFFHLRFGYRSLDVERASIWIGYGGWSNVGRGSSWLVAGESYEGVSPGFCSGGICDESQVPLDWGRMEHQGPLSWYGAMIPGGTGGCTLAVDGGTDVDGKPPQGSVMEQNQRVVCLLPLGAGPDGRCPGVNLR